MKNQKTLRNARFANHVTSMAFNLSLLKAMILKMSMIGNEIDHLSKSSWYAVGSPDIAVPACNALLSRGLVYAPDPRLPGVVEFTEAGKHVFELLKLAGLVMQAKEAINDYERKFG